MADCNKSARFRALPPVALGGLLTSPWALLAQMSNKPLPTQPARQTPRHLPLAHAQP